MKKLNKIEKTIKLFEILSAVYTIYTCASLLLKDRANDKK
jgi:hypothetical protein